MKERFSLDYYRTFSVVYECRSFSEAARRLYVTQSAISQSIKQLEILLDVCNGPLGVIGIQSRTVAFGDVDLVQRKHQPFDRIIVFIFFGKSSTKCFPAVDIGK